MKKTKPKRLPPKKAIVAAKRRLQEIRDEALWNLVEGGVARTYARSESPEDWQLLGSQHKGLMGLDQQAMIQAARNYFRNDPNARAAIMGILKYVMGRGVGITPKSKDPRVWYQWREFWTAKRNRMKIRQHEIVKRLFRDGEVFLRYFHKREGVDTHKVTVRFIDPLDIQRAVEQRAGVKDDTDVMHQGIEFDPDDPETPIRYWVRRNDGTDESDPVPAEDVQHIKLFADMDQSRAESFLTQIMPLFAKYKGWLEDRMILNKLRTAVVMIREIESGSAADFTSIADQLPVSSNGGRKSIKPASIYTAGPGVKLKMESANINANDVKEDGRNILLQMAAGTGMPEYLFGDASNQNFASSLIAESPFVKEVQFWQSYLESAWVEEMFRRVVQAAVDADKIEAPKDEDVFQKYRGFGGKVTLGEEIGDDVDDEESEGEADETEDMTKRYSETASEIFYGCDVQWPEIVHRDPKQQTEALVMQRDQGWLSDMTASEVLGYEYAEEVRKQKRIEDEAKVNDNPLMGIKRGEADADREEEEIAKQAMASLTPEERQLVLSGDTAAVAAMMKARLSNNGGQF